MKMRAVTVILLLDVDDDASASDAVNEILREQQRCWAPDSCLIDYAIEATSVDAGPLSDGYRNGEYFSDLHTKPHPVAWPIGPDSACLEHCDPSSVAALSIFGGAADASAADEVKRAELEGREARDPCPGDLHFWSRVRAERARIARWVIAGLDISDRARSFRTLSDPIPGRFR
jgi:hypothetical protein